MKKIGDREWLHEAWQRWGKDGTIWRHRNAYLVGVFNADTRTKTIKGASVRGFSEAFEDSSDVELAKAKS